MLKDSIYCGGTTGAARYAFTYLKSLGLPVVDEPGEGVGHLLLDVPSLGAGGRLRSGETVDSMLEHVGKDTILYGGNLNHPAFEGHLTVDLLQDAIYLAENARITAECALDVAFPYLNITLRRCPVLIIGWGRIGKCLGKLLYAMGAEVTIAARKGADRAMIHALGYHTADTADLVDCLPRFRLIFNTVPYPILSAGQMSRCHPDCAAIELASTDGILGDNVIVARGLPGIHMPESSGRLIAETFLRYYQKEETS